MAGLHCILTNLIIFSITKSQIACMAGLPLLWTPSTQAKSQVVSKVWGKLASNKNMGKLIFFKVILKTYWSVQINNSFISFTFCVTHSSQLKWNYKKSHRRQVGETYNTPQNWSCFTTQKGRKTPAPYSKILPPICMSSALCMHHYFMEKNELFGGLCCEAEVYQYTCVWGGSPFWKERDWREKVVK